MSSWRKTSGCAYQNIRANVEWFSSWLFLPTRPHPMLAVFSGHSVIISDVLGLMEAVNVILPHNRT